MRFVRTVLIAWLAVIAIGAASALVKPPQVPLTPQQRIDQRQALDDAGRLPAS